MRIALTATVAALLIACHGPDKPMFRQRCDKWTQEMRDWLATCMSGRANSPAAYYCKQTAGEVFGCPVGCVWNCSEVSK